MPKITRYNSDINPEITNIDLDIENLYNDNFVKITMTYNRRNIDNSVFFVLFNKLTLEKFIEELTILKHKI
ncbi:hypothetical protein UFOVP462_31 [uncultured Caudovirales phage]|uniref:Uncharacterized protein n=1 Tax=uncultured Caudovirales phage TaxID=2100421 RepID=A0A6J5MGT7_9CAUD|nr:hypothetical protein UFOVP462_31 [uncultured Caudovirales phage]